MKNFLNSVQVKTPKSNVFDLTHDVKMSLDMGKLYPCCVLEAVPGDKFSISAESLVRFAPLVSPMMHRVDITIHYFFVPNRLLWPNWEKFITGPDPIDPDYPLEPAFPRVTVPPQGAASLGNYLGVPMAAEDNIQVSAMPYAAYQCIYNEYYRDQNLIEPVDYELQDGDQESVNPSRLVTIRRRCWEHDYFTAALPFAQKGDPVEIPVSLPNQWVRMKDPGNPTGSGFIGVMPATDDPNNPVMSVKATASTADPDMGNSLFYVRLDDIGVLTNVNDLRRSYRLQEWLEKNARGGTRYIESILSHFGVKSSDSRLQRPEYICGMKSPVTISEVLNTTGTEELPQANMAGHGVGVTAGNTGTFFCEEHGFIMGIMSIMPKTAYFQGLPKHFDKFDRLDYYWPSFAHIGEQEIKNKEIYIDAVDPDGTFGYIPRYAEYKFQPSRVAGQFQETLDFWHLARKFATEPALNDDFVQCVPSKRVFAVPGEFDENDVVYAHILNKVKAVRRMPYFGTPTL